MERIYILNIATSTKQVGIEIHTSEGHLLCGVELDGVDCGQDSKDETWFYIKHPDVKQIEKTAHFRHKSAHV